MRNIFLISTFILSLTYRKAYALTAEECLQSLTGNNINDRKYAGSGNTYCAYSSNGSIVDATFNIKNSELNNWDITVGIWDNERTFIKTMSPTVVKENETYKIEFENTDNNAIIWTLNNSSSGEIENINIEEMVLKKRKDTISCAAFNINEGRMVWEDISWDTKTEKSINLSLGEINMNNTVYLNTIALSFMKDFKYRNNSTDNNYVRGEFTFNFKIKTDSNRWKVYGGFYNANSNKVDINYTWSLTPRDNDNVVVDNESKKNEITSKLPHNTENNRKLLTNHYYNIVLTTDESEEGYFPERTNIFWIVNDAFEGGSQRIWIKDIKVDKCSNSDDLPAY